MSVPSRALLGIHTQCSIRLASELGHTMVKLAGNEFPRMLFGLATHGMAEEELQAAFSTGWRIDSAGQQNYGWGTLVLAQINV